MIVRPLKRTRRRGATLVEFAVVVPIFFLLIFGMVDIARGFMVQTLIANAARVGCRTGVLQTSPATTTDQVKTAVTNALKGQGINKTTTTVSVNGSSSTNVSAAVAGDQITVTVSVAVSSISWLPGTHYLTGPISASFTLLHE